MNKDYIKKIHEQNFATQKKAGVRNGDILENIQSKNRYLVHVHPLYGWLTLEPLDPYQTSDKKPTQQWEGITDFQIVRPRGVREDIVL